MTKPSDASKCSIVNAIVLGRIFLSTLFWATCILLTSCWSHNKEHKRALADKWVHRLVAITGVWIDLIIEEPLSSAGGPFIFMANHQSFMDIPILAVVFWPFALSWVALLWLVHVPFFGWAFRQLDPILVEPGNKTRNRMALKAAGEQLSNGNSLLVFPEGGRSQNGQLLQLKAGFFNLALETKVPIVPVTIIGNGQILPPGSCTVKPGTVRVIVGRPLVSANSSLEVLMEAVRVTLDRHLKAPEVRDPFSDQGTFRGLNAPQEIYQLPTFARKNGLGKIFSSRA